MALGLSEESQGYPYLFRVEQFVQIEHVPVHTRVIALYLLCSPKRTKYLFAVFTVLVAFLYAKDEKSHREVHTAVIAILIFS